jgi:adenosylmethionine-8-amino-7-oxononanoate aminotransferase
VTDVQVFRDAYDPLLMRAHIVASPDGRLGNEAQALAAMRALLEARHARIACVIVEPLVQGAAGMVMHSPGYLKGLRELTREFGVHLIADEIAVGCGRTGSFFAWEQTQADWPDFLLLSKGITGGTLPLSLVLTTDDVFSAFWSEDVTRGFLHSHSYTGNPLACAAANAVLDRFDAGQLDANRAQADRLARAFAPLTSRMAHLRQRGMILAFDVPQAPPRFAEAFHLKAREHELLIRPIGNTVYLMPPYLIDDATAAFLAGAVTATLNDVLA